MVWFLPRRFGVQLTCRAYALRRNRLEEKEFGERKLSKNDKAVEYKK